MVKVIMVKEREFWQIAELLLEAGWGVLENSQNSQENNCAIVSF